MKGDILIDDDPGEIMYVKSIKKRGFRVVPYRKGKKLQKNDMEELYTYINKRKGFFKGFL